jgi:nucleoid-associated protein YgaU
MRRGAGRGRSIVMTKRKMTKVLALAVTSGFAAVAVAATVTDEPPAEVGTAAEARGPAAPAPGRATTGGSTAATARATSARPAVEPGTREALDDERYLVRAGDTLWDIATRHYQDPSAAMERIKRRNGLRREMLLAGEVLVLPAAGRRSEGSRADENCPADEAATDDAPPAP